MLVGVAVIGCPIQKECVCVGRGEWVAGPRCSPRFLRLCAATDTTRTGPIPDEVREPGLYSHERTLGSFEPLEPSLGTGLILEATGVASTVGLVPKMLCHDLWGYGVSSAALMSST